MRHADSFTFAPLTLAFLSLACAGTPPGSEEGPTAGDAPSESFPFLLDTDNDGHIGRYEAAAAAMLYVDHMRGAGTEAEGVLSDDPLTFEIDGSRAIATGVIDARSPGRLVQVLLSDSDVDEVVLKRVEDSCDPAALTLLLSLIKDSGVSLRVPADGMIMGPGIALLSAADRRYVEPGAQIRERDILDEPRAISDAQIEERGLRTEAHGLVLVPTGTSASLRGLAAVSADVAWATGSGATVARTVDGGATWRNVAPDSIAGLDVRDVYAVDANIAWIMSAGPAGASRILFTDDGGTTWTEQHRETAPEAFLDGFDFWEPGRGVCYGDPMADGRFRVLLTTDGATWAPIEEAPAALEGGEASFAGSGTGVRVLGRQRGWIVTGATDGTSRVFSTEDAGATWSAATTPLAAPKPGAGAFSVSFTADGSGVLVGGNYLERDLGGAHVAAWSRDFGKTWYAPSVGPRGQRAGSVSVGNGVFLATGQTGTDISRDGGQTWRAFSSEGFYCVDVSPTDGTVWFAGAQGRAARLK